MLLLLDREISKSKIASKVRNILGKPSTGQKSMASKQVIALSKMLHSLSSQNLQSSSLQSDQKTVEK